MKKLWEKFKKFFETPLCTQCNKNRQDLPFSITECTNCFRKNCEQSKIRLENQERENEINKLAEAMKRAFPRGPYR